MTRKKRDEQLFRVGGLKGGKLTPSKKRPGAFSPLVHGKGGISEQAVLIPVEDKGRSRSLAAKLARAGGKVLVLLLAICLTVVVAGVLISAIVDGAATGMAQVAHVVSKASTYLVMVASAGLLTLVLLMVVRKSMGRRRHARRGARSAEQPSAGSSMSRQAPPASLHASVTGPPAPPAGWLADPRQEAAPPGWYPSADGSQVRYWDGGRWTDHVAYALGGPDRSGQPVVAHAPLSGSGDQTFATMSSAEWQRHFQTWLAAGAIEQELWRRLMSTRISDADQLTLEAQWQMGQLGPEQGARQLRMLLDASPRLREDLLASQVLLAFLQGGAAADRGEPLPIDRPEARRGYGHPTGLV